MEVDPDELESKLLKELEDTNGWQGRTLIAFALAD
jgi:hypothetical protein